MSKMETIKHKLSEVGINHGTVELFLRRANCVPL